MCPHVHWDIAACGIWSLGIWLPCPLDPYTSTSSSSTFSAPQKALPLAIWTWFNLRVNTAAGSCRQGGPGAIAGGDRKGDGGRGRLWVMQDLITWVGRHCPSQGCMQKDAKGSYQVQGNFEEIRRAWSGQRRQVLTHSTEQCTEREFGHFLLF